MTLSFRERLQASRHAQFVGRADELTLFKTAVAAPQMPFHILHVSGSGGVGKTSLLHEFEYQCQRLQLSVYYLDAIDIEPSPSAFIAGLREAMSLAADVDPLTTLSQTEWRHVILIDQFDYLIALERWLQRQFLLQLPDNTLIVLASRQSLSDSWHVDPGWRSLVHTLALPNFTLAEGRSYLEKHGIPKEAQEGILSFTYSHPLALALVADLFVQQPDLQFEPDAVPDTLRKLVTRFVDNATTRQRMALEACALVRRTTEQLLAEMLGESDVHALFNWLRTLSLIESGAQGLWVQNLARDTLTADLRWRNAERYAQLHERARQYYGKRLRQLHGRAQQNILVDYIFLHRDNPVVRPFFIQLQEMGAERVTLLADVAVTADWPALVKMVRHHEGEVAAQLLEYWLPRQPEGVMVFRDQDDHIKGFLFTLTLETMSKEERARDAAVQAVWHYLEQYAPLRSQEKALFFRFWLDGDGYQALSPTQSLIFVHMVRYYLTTPNLAYTFLPCAKPDDWMMIFAYADLVRLPEADFEIDGGRYGVYGHDWRRVPPQAWLDLLAARETSPNDAQIAQTTQPDAFVVLSREQFDTAVREALRTFTQPEPLAANPLLQTRLLLKKLKDASTNELLAKKLQELIEETAQPLKESERTKKWYDALHYTYLKPMSSQEVAAEFLNVPYGSFRRYLKAGVDYIVNVLWQYETDQG